MTPDVREVDDAVHPDSGQLVAGPDPGEQQDVRRPDGARAQHHLGARGHLLAGAVLGAVGDPGGPNHLPVRLEQDPLDERAGDHGEVLPVHRGLEVGVEGRAAPAVLRRRLEERGHPLGVEAVATVVVTLLQARGARGLDELGRGAEDRLTHRHTHRAVVAMHVEVGVQLGAVHEALGLEEVGQDLVIGPALRAPGGPRVEVAGVPPHVRHVVQAGGAAEHLPPGHHHLAPDQALSDPTGVAVVHPVGRGVVLQARDRGRHQLRGRRRAAGLEQAHLDLRVLAQAGGDHGARRSRPHDHVVIRRAHRYHLVVVPRRAAGTVSPRNHTPGGETREPVPPHGHVGAGREQPAPASEDGP